jgi:hypothetical protein
MKRKIVAAVSAALLLMLSVYGVLFTSKPPATPHDEALAEEPAQFALKYFAWLKAKNWQAIKGVTDPSVWSASNQRTFEVMADTIPQTEPAAIHLVGSRWSKSSSKPERNEVTLEYLYPGKPLLKNIVMDRRGDGFVVLGAHITPIIQPLEQYYEFHFLDRSLTHYKVAAVATVLIALNLYALVHCIMMQGLRRKWLWIIFILFGYGWVQFNWTEGTFAFSLLYLAMPIVRVAQGAYQPLTIGISLPLGTFIFLIRWYAHQRRQRAAISQFD